MDITCFTDESFETPLDTYKFPGVVFSAEMHGFRDAQWADVDLTLFRENQKPIIVSLAELAELRELLKTVEETWRNTCG